MNNILWVVVILMAISNIAYCKRYRNCAALFAFMAESAAISMLILPISLTGIVALLSVLIIFVGVVPMTILLDMCSTKQQTLTKKESYFYWISSVAVYIFAAIILNMCLR